MDTYLNGKKPQCMSMERFRRQLNHSRTVKYTQTRFETTTQKDREIRIANDMGTISTRNGYDRDECSTQDKHIVAK